MAAFSMIDADGRNGRIFVVAEIGNNHEGSYAVAEKLIVKAAETGVNAVKFQTFIPELLTDNSDVSKLQQLRRFQLSYKEFENLATLAAECGVVFFSTPLDIESAKFLNEIQPLFKIASGDNTFLPLIETVAGFGKPFIVSTGLADMESLVNLHGFVRDIWSDSGVTGQLAFLHCVSSYPVPDGEANLGAIRTLVRAFPDTLIGYSDHTMNPRTIEYAVAAGARIVEKHFTLDKNFSNFRDHKLAADPEEMTSLVQAIRDVDRLLGSGCKEPQACEAELLVGARRSIAVSKEIPEGTVLEEGHLTWVRPGGGVPPGFEKDVLGKVTTRTFHRGELIDVNFLRKPA